VKREYHRWFSPSLGREMELLVFGPAASACAKVLIFPTREGRFYDYENWGMVEALTPSIKQGWLELICVDSVDSESLYAGYKTPESRIARHGQYESYILNEVIPFMRSQDPHAFLMAHGCSIGAYHAINLGLRHPGLFGKILALSGRYDLTRRVGPFADLFDTYYDQNIYFHTPTHFLPQMNDSTQIEALRRMEIILVVGETDPFRASTEELSGCLWDKGIWNALEIWPGEAHRPRYWRQMVRAYL
jgi:esterase/lipase superfamily enzyme